MFSIDDSASLTLDELTWLSASTLIENQYALSESPSNERGARALFNAVFSNDSQSEFDVEHDVDDDEYASRRDSPPPPPISTARVHHGQGSLSGPGLGTFSSSSSTPGTTATAGTGTSSDSGSASPFLSGRQPITPPPTPPRRHLHPPRYLSHDGTPGTPATLTYPHTPTSTHTPPSPSPSVSSSNLSSTSRTQTEWIYRRPKASPNPVNGGQGQGGYDAGNNGLGLGNNGSNTSTTTMALLGRHRFANNSATALSATASCSSRQISRSPSNTSSSYRTTTPNASDTSGTPNPGTPALGIGSKNSKRSSKNRSHAGTVAAKPRPSSPILISSTSQLVDSSPTDPHPGPLNYPNALAPSLEKNASRSPSLHGNTAGGGGGLSRSNVNASVSSLQLQSSIRVSPLKNRNGRGAGSGNSSSSSLVGTGSGSVAQPQQSPAVPPMGIEWCSSNTSTTTNRSVGKPIWTALRGKVDASTSTLASTTTTTKNRTVLLKSIPSKSQISIGSSVTPTFVTPLPSSPLPLLIPSTINNSNNSPKTPTRVRHTLNGGTPSFGTGTTSSPRLPPTLPQKDKDRPFQRRDKFASAPPIPGIVNVGVGAQTPSTRCYSTSASSATPLSGVTGANDPSDSTCVSGPPFLTFEPSPTTLGMRLGLGPCGVDSASSPCPSPSPSPTPTSNSTVGKTISSPTPLSRFAENPRSRRRRRSSSSSNVGNRADDPNGRDRTSSITSQTSIATATTTHTTATTGTNSSASPSSSSTRSHPQTPTTTPSPIPVPGVHSSPSTSSFTKPVSVPGVYNFRRSSSNSSMMTTSGGTPPSFPYHHHLHGLGNGGGEKRSQFLSNHQPPYQHRHQRQNSTSSSVSFNGTGVGFGNTNGGNTAAAIAASVARSQAYAQLTGTATVAGLGLGMGVPGGNANVTSVSSKRRRPSTSPGSTTGSGSETSSIHSQLSPYGRRFAQSQRLGSEPGSETLVGNRSANTLMPLSSSAPSSTSRPTPSSSVSLSHYGNSVVTRSPRSPHHAPLHHLTSSLPKSKSILTRTSSMSTKNSGCGGTVKSVKFVEIPEVHYRSGCYDQDGNEYVYGYDGGGPSGSDDADGGDGSRDEDQDMDEDDNLAVGAKGEGQEGMVLRECMGLDIEAIDMDIDTYLGVGKAVEAEEGGEKESKLSFKRMPGLGWGFLSKSKKAEKENRREEDESKDSIVPPTEVEQKKEEKDKSSSGFGLKRLMGFTARKTPPPPLSLSISSPFSLGPKSPTTVAASQTERSTEQRKTKQSTSPPVSPRKPISGPYALGSRLPSRSPPTHSSLPSPSSSFIQQPISSRFNPASSSNTSLNRTNQGRQFSMNNHGNATHRSRSIRSTHRTNPSLTTVTNLGMNTERPVGPNIAGTRPKGFVGNDEVLSLNAVPLKNATSCESFRSARSYGGRSVRSEVGSMKSAKSVGGGSTRSFRTWMNRNGVGQGYSGTNVAVAVAE